MAIPNTDKSKFSNLSKRLSSAITLAIIVLGALTLGPKFFTILMAIGASILLFEWLKLVNGWGILWKIGGVIYIAAATAALAALSFVETGESLVPMAIIFILLTVAATDIGAYFSGKTIGGPKLCPSISPGKTWAGLIGGAICAAIVSWLMIDHVPYPDSIPHALLLGVIIALLAQIGDLFISWMKRKAGVKDTGSLLPGHGGLFDRMDGLMLTAPFYLTMAIQNLGTH